MLFITGGELDHPVFKYIVFLWWLVSGLGSFVALGALHLTVRKRLVSGVIAASLWTASYEALGFTAFPGLLKNIEMSSASNIVACVVCILVLAAF